MKEEKKDKWKIERKKERNRWIWTMIFLVAVFWGLAGYSYYLKYSETTVIRVVDRIINDFSMDSYHIGTISLETENLKDNKKITLSKDDITDLMVQLQDISVRGVKEDLVVKSEELYNMITKLVEKAL